MSLLQKIKDRKLKLSHTETIVKTVTGDILKENRTDDGITIERLPEVGSGFVIDTKPDLQVAEILPGVYLGSQDVALEVSLLKQYDIKNILSVGIEVDKLDSIKYTHIEALDLPEFNIFDVFEETYNIIYKIVNLDKERVFVHCNAGISRSATIVIAYVMKFKNCPYVKAYELVKKCRSVIKPNPGFVKQLLLYESYLTGKYR